MIYKLICCEVLMRMVCLAIAKTPHIIDPEFTKIGLHEKSDKLKKELQGRIDNASKSGKYDAILLGYGLCGNGTSGLEARNVQLVMPRAHDCCTLFLGSRKEFLDNFGNNLSSQWGSAGYMERDGGYLRNTDTGKILGLDKDYQQLVKKYGEENAIYIWETLHPEQHNDELIFIEVPELSHLGYMEKMKSVAEKEGKNLKVICGSMKLIEGLVRGNWCEEDYLIVPPGKSIKPVYDHEKIITV